MSWVERVLHDLEVSAMKSGAKSPRDYLMSLDDNTRHVEIQRLGAMLFGANEDDLVMIDDKGRIYIVKGKKLVIDAKAA